MALDPQRRPLDRGFELRFRLKSSPASQLRRDQPEQHRAVGGIERSARS